jgi:hypothetical protein
MMKLDPDFNRVKIVSLVKDFATASELPAPIDIELLEGPGIQRFLLKLANGAKSDSMCLSLGPRQKVLFDAMRSIEFVPWLGVLPSSTLNQHIHNDVFKAAVGFQLGMKFKGDGRSGCEGKKCKVLMDMYGEHATNCKFGGGAISRHNIVRDTLASLCRQSGFICRIEEKDLLPDTDRRPADVFVLNWALDKSVCIDVAVVCGRETNAIKSKEEDKKRLNLVDCENAGYKFEPFVLDSYGRMGISALRVLNKLAVGYAETHEIHVAVAKGRLRGLIMQSMIREQGRQIVERMWGL